MGFIHPHSGTKIEEIAEGIHRISTPVPPEIIPDGFTYNQFLIDDEQPLLYHTGLRRMFPLVRDAVAGKIVNIVVSGKFAMRVDQFLDGLGASCT